MFRRLVLLSLCTSACTSVKTSCKPYPSSAYANTGRLCTGRLVTHVPWLLPTKLQLLMLTSTAISSLDNQSFQGRDLLELRTLHVTGGTLSSVKAHAFCALPALTMLYLDDNRLDVLDELSFSCNQFLRTVSLVDNPRLRHLPRLVSPTVEHLYLDSCGLTNIDVHTVDGMTALQVLSLTGNRNLNCSSVKAQFMEARPALLVICEDFDGDLSSSTSPSNEEPTSEYSLTDSSHPHPALKNKEKYTTVNASSSITPSFAAIAGISIVVIISFW